MRITPKKLHNPPFFPVISSPSKVEMNMSKFIKLLGNLSICVRSCIACDFKNACCHNMRDACIKKKRPKYKIASKLDI